MRLPNTDGSGNKILLPLFGCLPVIWLAVLFAQAIQPGMGLTEMMGSLTAALSNPFALTWTERTPKCILLFLLAYGMGIGIYWSNRRNYRRGEEHGSAVWGDTGQIVKRYQAPKYEDNLLLTRRFRMGLDGHKHKRNLNVLVVGGSGAGKTRYYARPNIMQGNCSFIITDPKAELLRSTGNLLKSKGYEVRVFDLINPEASMCYNPFRYIDDDKDVLRLISNLIKNTTPKGSHESDPFWTKAETALLQALMLYLIREAPEDEQTFAMILEMISSAEVREDDETFQSPLDLLFENLENRDPLNIAVKQYKVFKQAAGKTAKSILVSCGARLAPFDIAELREITMYDELELDTLGDKIFVNPKNKKDTRYYKTALFLIMSDTDSTFNFLISMIYTQLFNLLCEKADDVYGGRLPVHVRCLIDEAANIGQIPNLEKLVATIRSREISACLVLQAQSQLKALYKDNADTIIGNMDSRIFLGGAEPTTLKELNQSLGKETIDTFNTGESRGREVSHSLNYQKLGKDLATIDELAVLDGGKCILQLRGVRPFMSNKFDITKHPQYKYLSDANPKNNFDIEKFLSTQLKTKPDDVYEVFEVDASDVSATA